MQLETIEKSKPARLIWWTPVHFDTAAIKYLEAIGHAPTPQIIQQVTSTMRNTLAQTIKMAQDKALLIDAGKATALPRFDLLRGETHLTSSTEVGSYPWVGKMLHELETAATGTKDQKYSVNGDRYTFLDYTIDRELSPHCYDSTREIDQNHRWRVAIISEVRGKDENHPTPYQTATLSLIGIDTVDFADDE